MTEDDADGRERSPDGQSREVTVDLVVPEMDCPTCAKSVDRQLQQLDGVIEASLRPTTGTVSVTFDPDGVEEAEVIAAIESAGYDVLDRDGADTTGTPDSGAEMAIAPPSAVWRSRRAILTWIGGVVVVLGLLLKFVLAGQNPVVATVLSRPITLAGGLFLLAVAISGTPVLRDGARSARNRSLDIDLLMSVAIVAAAGVGYLFEAATLAVLYSIAELLETYAMDRARDSLRELMDLSPEEATVRRDGQTVTVPVESVEIGETVIVRPGEKIPLDGTVIEGTSAVDESPITGESVPVDKSTGEEVFAGTINEEGYLEVRVTSTAGDSTLARIIELVQGASAKQTDAEQFVDRFAGYYTPIIVVLAILTAALPPLLLGLPWRTWFIRGLTLLVIACPCAFVISTPVSVVSGITSAAKNGVLIKGGTHLETMGGVGAVAFDKTGTLTKGELAVTDVVPFGTASEEKVLRYAAALEERSEHPIAGAIRTRANAAGVSEHPPLADFESLPGKGVRAAIDGETHYAGKPGVFESLGVWTAGEDSATDGGTPEPTGTDPRGAAAAETEVATGSGSPGWENAPADVVAELEASGKTVVLVGTERELLGAIAVADEIRPSAASTVSRLRDLGVESVVMLTGDNEGTASAIAGEVGVDYRAGLLPEEKVEAVGDLQTAYGGVAMVGDGINDAPALATADVGIAMGAAGTDTALETADIALMGDDISTLPYLYALSRSANGVIRQNIYSSLAVKALLAVGVPLGYVSVALAVVVGDMGMSLGVTGNAMRLSRLRPDRFFDG